MTRNKHIVVALVLAAAATGRCEDALSRIEHRLAAAECCRFTFLSVVESDVFETVDTARGSAHLAKDGRYCVGIGDDLYVYDGEFLHSYSAAQNQVTVEKAARESAHSEEISFVTHLSDYYKVRTVKADREYFLTRTDSAAGGIPDSLRVFVSDTQGKLDSLQYYDFNGDFNRILFLKQETLPECREDQLSPALPDSAEVIKL